MLAEFDWQKVGVENGSDGYFWLEMKIDRMISIDSPVQALDPFSIDKDKILSTNFLKGAPVVIYRSGAVGTCLVTVNKAVVEIESMERSHYYPQHDETITNNIVGDARYETNILTHLDKFELSGKLKEDSDKKITAKIYFVPREQ